MSAADPDSLRIACSLLGSPVEGEAPERSSCAAKSRDASVGERGGFELPTVGRFIRSASANRFTALALLYIDAVDISFWPPNAGKEG